MLWARRPSQERISEIPRPLGRSSPPSGASETLRKYPCVLGTIRFDARLGLAGAVLIAGKALVVEDAYKSPLFYPSIDSLTGFQTRNILSVPLRTAKQEIVGVFQVLNKRDGKFTTEDEHFVQALANQAAIALENTQTLTELENRQQELLEENQNL